MSRSIPDYGISLHIRDDAGFGGIVAVCKQILNELMALAQRPIERRRLAALTSRQLEDIGMTPAERDALLY
jgi:uncharacterized protein YjiS (DUF1127 family)